MLVYSAEEGARPLPLAELYRRHWAELSGYVRRAFGPGPPEPEDVTQAAFARLAALEGAPDVLNPRAFLFQTARNIVFDHRRREAVRARLRPEISLLAAEDAPAIVDGERVLSAKERLAIVEAAIRAMESRRRKVLVMHAINGVNLSEVGRRLGISPTRATQLLADAVAICKRALREADERGGDLG